MLCHFQLHPPPTLICIHIFNLLFYKIFISAYKHYCYSYYSPHAAGEEEGGSRIRRHGSISTTSAFHITQEYDCFIHKNIIYLFVFRSFGFFLLRRPTTTAKPLLILKPRVLFRRHGHRKWVSKHTKSTHMWMRHPQNSNAWWKYGKLMQNYSNGREKDDNKRKVS